MQHRTIHVVRDVGVYIFADQQRFRAPLLETLRF
jgi:hypothetical protein